MRAQTRGKRALTRAAIIPAAKYAVTRRQRRQAIGELKKRRRFEVVSSATFENYAQMWRQAHEILHVEKRGEAEITDELAAYNVMISRGDEPVATIVRAIDDRARRANVLPRFCAIENDHPNYAHMAVMPEAVRVSLAEDFA